jgi:D-beta-D-heptose 7-phosphate kinase / D-beta-D-heptose 1-phosphate adenosyltransferase
MSGVNPRIVVLGDLLLDSTLWGRCDRISPEAPVPIVDVERRTQQLGGAGNVVSNLRALEAEVTLISVVGQDAAAARLRELLREEGVDDRALVVVPDRRTPEKTRIVASSHQVLRYDDESTTAVEPAVERQLLEAASEAIPGCQALIISDYGKGVVTGAVCQGAIALARSRQIPALCDPKRLDFSVYRRATVVTPNRKEASLAARLPIVDDDSLRRAGELLLREHELERLLITLSGDGMALFDGQTVERIHAQAREVYDVSGAGDTVIATLAYGLATGLSMSGACRLANTAAGIVVGKLGAARVSIDELRPALTRDSARKVVALDRLERVAERLRRRGRRVVFTNGCFDLIHAGHVRFLEDAAAEGDVLIVGLNSDASIQRLKGPERPIQDERDRAALLAALQAVSYVVLFDEDTPLELIRRLRPDVLVKGADYTVQTVVGADLVQGYGGRVVLAPIMADRSTSGTIARIVERFKS